MCGGTAYSWMSYSDETEQWNVAPQHDKLQQRQEAGNIATFGSWTSGWARGSVGSAFYIT
jgi:hypothetical protein